MTPGDEILQILAAMLDDPEHDSEEVREIMRRVLDTDTKPQPVTPSWPIHPWKPYGTSAEFVFVDTDNTGGSTCAPLQLSAS